MRKINNILVVMIIIFLSKIMGFLREIFLSMFFGASFITDAFLISLMIPSVLFSVIGTGITNSYIPMYENIKNNDGIENANKFTVNLLVIMFLFSTMIIMLSYFNSTKLLNIFMSEKIEKDFIIIDYFFKVSIITIYFSSIIFIFSSFLQVHNKYTIVLIISLIPNVITLISIVYASKYNIYILPIGNFIGLFLQSIIIFYNAKRIKLKIIDGIKLNIKYLKKYFLSTIPIIFGVSLNQINVIIDRNIASNFFLGALTIITYSEKIISLIYAIILTSIINITYPILSRKYNINKELFFNKVFEIIELIIIILIPINLIIIFFSEEIVTLLFGRGRFLSKDIYLTSNLLKMYSISIIFYGVREVLIRVMYICNRIKFILINSSIGILLNIILNILLTKFFNLNGLALATSISTIISTLGLLLYFYLQNMIKKNIIIDLFKICIKSLLISGIMIGTLKYILIILITKFTFEKSLLIVFILLSIILAFIIFNYLEVLKKKLKIFNDT